MKITQLYPPRWARSTTLRFCPLSTRTSSSRARPFYSTTEVRAFSSSKDHAIIGIMHDEVDPLLNVMKVEKAPLESYADIGGLETQIQEIKEAVELPLTHPEIYEDMGIKPPKGKNAFLTARGHFVR